MASFWPCGIVAPRAVTLCLPGLQRLFLCGADVMHSEQGPISLSALIWELLGHGLQTAHGGGILAALYCTTGLLGLEE